MRQRKSWILPAMLLGAGVLLSGCAEGDEPGRSPSSSSPGQTSTVDLQISIRANGTDETTQHHLLCEGPVPLERSNHPRAAEACALLAASPRLLIPPAANATRMCTQQYGGPAVAQVSGVLDGRAVARSFDLRDGCGISDWAAALALLVDQPARQVQ